MREARRVPHTRSTPMDRPSPPDRAGAQPPEQPGCTVALRLPAGLLDCHFGDCPETLLMPLLTATNLRLTMGADGIVGLTEHRHEPPRVRRIATLIQDAGQWQLTASDSPPGRCGEADPMALGDTVTGISVRRILTEPKTRESD